jgi:MFS transporter, AAHS family, 4-hydroxybenzoate transporter
MRFTDRYGPITVLVFPLMAVPLLLCGGLVSLGTLSFIVVCVLAQSLIGGAHFSVLSITGLFYPTTLRASGAALAASVGKSASVLGPLVGVGILTSALPTVRLYAVLAIFPFVLVTIGVMMAIGVHRRPRVWAGVGEISGRRARAPARSAAVSQSAQKATENFVKR